MPDLKPCPFCGKPAKVEVMPYSDRIVVSVHCGGACPVSQYDQVEGDYTFDALTRAMDNAMCAWNRRVKIG